MPSSLLPAVDPIVANIENVLPQALEWSRAGERICLATMVHVAGSAPRPLGSQMAIAGNGEYYGYLSGGCAERAIADVGLAAVRGNGPRVARFGVGSPYLDVQLPCGSGIDVHYALEPRIDVLEATIQRLSERQVAAIDIDPRSGLMTRGGTAPRSVSCYRRHYYPLIHLIVVGAGPVAIELARLGAVQGFAVTLVSPDEVTLQAAGAAREMHLRDARQLDALAVDAHTAVVTAFHEHDRELAVWERCAPTSAFYLGALGSRRSHDERCRALAERSVDADAIARIHGPAGLATGGKTAVEIALSIVAELRAVYRGRALPDLEWGGGALTDEPPQFATGG